MVFWLNKAKKKIKIVGLPKKMGLQEFLHMNEGDGEISYSQNSFVQKAASLMGQPMLERAIQSVITEVKSPSKVIKVADLGCGVGPVPLAVVKLVIENVQKKCEELKWKDNDIPEIIVFLNDLPSNDFSFLFKELLNMDLLKKKEGVPLCYLMTTPGSYYGRLFPKNVLHFVHANYTLHWLSQAPSELYSEEGIPINKGNVYITESSPKIVAKAYMSQFQQDFTKFLICRSEEVYSNGRMLLTLRGRPTSSDAVTWQPWELEIMAQAITKLVSQGLIKEEKLDTFDFPYFGPNEDDIESIVHKEGSFVIENVNTMAQHVAHEIEDNSERAKVVSKFVRSFTESLISRHFGEDVLEPLYEKFTQFTCEHLAKGKPIEHHSVIILLKKI
ncbi:caffeine synthase 1-like [Chenopodium quinoa]|uniref:caffeine synthase 1-like n=1 Tax=Chenopodium quinoa TaxID=63459 RepID=UPI000B76DC04|nr:caffeine synthase 1-like [Chenopodium quinoa]